MNERRRRKVEWNGINKKSHETVPLRGRGGVIFWVEGGMEMEEELVLSPA
jgi:hypothetical protein